MGDLVSLKLHRKRRNRAEKDAQAAENRTRFGRTRDERDLTDARNDKADRDLDGHKREE